MGLPRSSAVAEHRGSMLFSPPSPAFWVVFRGRRKLGSCVSYAAIFEVESILLVLTPGDPVSADVKMKCIFHMNTLACYMLQNVCGSGETMTKFRHYLTGAADNKQPSLYPHESTSRITYEYRPAI